MFFLQGFLLGSLFLWRSLLCTRFVGIFNFVIYLFFSGGLLWRLLVSFRDFLYVAYHSIFSIFQLLLFYGYCSVFYSTCCPCHLTSGSWGVGLHHWCLARCKGDCQCCRWVFFWIFVWCVWLVFCVCGLSAWSWIMFFNFLMSHE